MPPPSSQRAQVEPPEQVTTEAVKGFAVGALRVCIPLFLSLGDAQSRRGPGGGILQKTNRLGCAYL